MRNFFRKRRNPQFGEAGSGENVRPDLDPRVTPFGPRLVSDLGDPEDDDPDLGSYRRWRASPLMRAISLVPIVSPVRFRKTVAL